jgi:hypothetical protein
MRYLDPEQPVPVSAGPSPSENMAWTGVSKGLTSVLAGYVLSILNAAGSLVILWIGTRGFRKNPAEATGDTFTVLLLGGAVLFFTSLFSTYLVLRGKWRCMFNAPERGGARWLMFASMICICAGPVLTYASGLVGGKTTVQPQHDESRLKPGLERSALLYARRLRENDLGGYMRLAGGIISPLAPVFFVLFIRAIHRCMGRVVATRFTELYLFFVFLLFVGTLSMLLDPRVRLQTDLLIWIGIGWVVATVLYFLVILAAVFGISAYLNAPPKPTET